MRGMKIEISFVGANWGVSFEGSRIMFMDITCMAKVGGDGECGGPGHEIE
jgi:hypothetical protein